MIPAIETQALTKRFPPAWDWAGLIHHRKEAGTAEGEKAAVSARTAVSAVDLVVNQGELFGLLGPNGAGKTTLIKLLSTLIVPTSGRAKVNGFDLSQESDVKRTIGLANSDERSFYWRLTGRQNLEFFAALQGMGGAQGLERVQAVLEQTGMVELAGVRFQTYSTGMRQRLSIARALLAEPPLLFLDEPTRGLDPAAARGIQGLIQELNQREGTTIFLTTHNLGEAQRLCGGIAIIDRGRIRACGTAAELRSELGASERYQVRMGGLNPAAMEGLKRQLEALPACRFDLQDTGPEPEAEGGCRVRIGLDLQEEDGTLDAALTALRRSGGQIRSIAHEPASLECIFAHFTEGGGEVEGRGEGDSDPGMGGQEGQDSILPYWRGREEGREGSLHYEGGREEGQDSILPYKGGGKTGQDSILPYMRVAGAFIRRDLLTESSYRFSFFLQFFNIFFTAAVFYFVSRLLGPAAAPFLAPYGGDYFAFVLIGIALGGYFGTGLSSFSNSLRQAQTTGTLEAMLATPTGLSTIILSSSLWEFGMTTVRVLAYLAIGAGLMGVDLGGGNYPAASLILLLTVTAFSSLGILAASFIMVLKRGDPLTWAFSALSSLLGGVYYPVAVLPAWMQALSRLLPITYALQGMRLALLQGASFRELLPEILALGLFSAILLPLSLLAFRYAVRRTRIDGSLTHY